MWRSSELVHPSWIIFSATKELLGVYKYLFPCRSLYSSSGLTDRLCVTACALVPFLWLLLVDCNLFSLSKISVFFRNFPDDRCIFWCLANCFTTFFLVRNQVKIFISVLMPKNYIYMYYYYYYFWSPESIFWTMAQIFPLFWKFWKWHHSFSLKFPHAT